MEVDPLYVDVDLATPVSTTGPVVASNDDIYIFIDIQRSNPFVGGVVSRPLAAVAVGLAYPDGMNEEVSTRRHLNVAVGDDDADIAGATLPQ